MKPRDLAIKMPKPAFVKEHQKLIGILRHGSKKVQSKEASEQSKELKKYQ